MIHKLNKGDKVVINSRYLGVNPNRYVVLDIRKDSKNNLKYELKYDRKNATSKFLVYVEDLDSCLKIPTYEELTSNIGLAFLNFNSAIKYDEELIEKIKLENEKAKSNKKNNK